MVLATQCIMQPKPKSMRITVDGNLHEAVTPKDVVLYIISQLSTSGATGYFVEYAGEVFENMSMEGRMTVCNMSIEMGARGGMIAPDETTFQYIKGREFAPKGEEWQKAMSYWQTLKTDEGADFDKSIRIAENAKTQRYGTCNTMETLLVHEKIAQKILPPLCKIYLDKGVELRGDKASCAIEGKITEATEEDWRTEYLAPILSVRIVNSLDQAIEHIAKFGSQHTDSIVTEDYSRARRFLREVDSSSVMVNTSTRFADGFEYGLGAEIGISTDKIHARGPVGLEGLTSQKFIVLGNGQIRQ